MTDHEPSLNEFGQPVGALVLGWVPRPRPDVSPIEGRYCRIEKLAPRRHIDELFAAYGEAPDDRHWTYLPVGPFQDATSFRRHFEAAAASPDPYHYAILDPRTGTAVGSAALMRIDPANGSIEVGFISYSPRLRRAAAGTEAMYLLMRRAFDELGYRRYEWKCDRLNAPSCAAALRYGFVFEGIFRQAVVVKGRNRDTAWYSITDREWPAIRAGFEAWLDPENFTESGEQRRGLADLRLAL